MANLIPGQVLKPSREDLQMIGSEVDEIILDLEREYAPFFSDVKVWWDWYEAEPRRKRKDFPFKNASNIVVPLIQAMTDALVARQLGNIFGADERVWWVTSENEDNRELARNLSRGLNWAAKGNDFDFILPIYDWLGELYPIGSSVVAINYRRDIRPLFFGPGSDQRGKLRSRFVELNRGVNFEHIPREQILWDTRFNISDAPVVVREHSFTWSQLKAFSQIDPSWNAEVIEELRDQTGKDFLTEGGKVATFKDTLAGREQTIATLKEHDVREVHIDWPILRGLGFELPGKEDLGTPDLPLVIYFHKRTKKILRITAEPYHLPYKPFFDGFFRKRSGQGHSVGVAKKLEQIQRIMTTLFNQSIDAVTRANAVWGKTTNARHLSEPIDPTQWIKVSQMDEIQEFGFPKVIQPDLALGSAANVLAERLIGISDPGLGRETRLGGHPSPATSTLALLDQGQVMANTTNILLRRQISRMGEAAAAIYQQHETDEDGKWERVLGDVDRAELDEFFFPTEPIPVNYKFDVVGLSDTLNPDTEMKRATTVFQADAAYWNFVLQGAAAVDNPQLPPTMKAMWVQAIQNHTKIYERFLNAANIDEMEKFVAQLKQLGLDSAGAQREFADNAGALAQGNGAVQAAGPAGAAAGAPPLGTPGGLQPVGLQ